MSTNIRTVMLTYIFLFSVHCYSRPNIDPTATTSLTILDVLPWPAAMGDSTAVAFALEALPFGLAELSAVQMGLVVPDVDMCALLRGTASDAWTDMELTVGYSLGVTKTLRFGLLIGASWQSARGFLPATSAQLALQALYKFTPNTMFSVAVNNVAGIGARYKPLIEFCVANTTLAPLSILARFAPNNVTQLELAYLQPLTEEVSARCFVRNAPLSAGASFVLRHSSIGAIVMSAEALLDLGIRSRIGIEF